MSRLPITQTSQLEAPPTKLPYNSHPIFKLRKLLIILAAIGAVLCFFSGDPYNLIPFFGCSFFLILSILFAMCDLTAYALKKAQHPDHDPEWPKVIFMVGDAFLALVLQLSFWTAIGALSYTYGSNVGPAYAALMAFACSLVHGYSFWKELMARCEKRFLLRLILEPCPRCGYHEAAEATTAQQAQQPQPPNTFAYAGPSASFHQATAHTPTSQESSMEEGLLIGSELSRNYGSAGPSEPTIGQPDDVVVAKGKGKKKRIVEGDDKSIV